MPGQLGDRVLKPVILYTAAGVPVNVSAMPVVLYDVNGNAVPVATSGTFANRPVSGLVNGQMYYATDLGSGLMIVWNGANWKPIGGNAVITQGGNVQSFTGSLTQTKVASVTIPGGLLSANGGIEMTWNLDCSSTVAFNTDIYYGPAGTTADTHILNYHNGAGSDQNAVLLNRIINANSLTAQTRMGNLQLGYGWGSSTTVITPANNTVNPQIFSIWATLGATADVFRVNDYSARWIEP